MVGAARGRACHSRRGLFRHGRVQGLQLPGPESPWGREKLQLGTAAAAEDAFEKAVAAADSKIKYVTDTDLEMKHDRMGTVADVMSRWSEHLRDHAQQIRATANA
ncbi:MAG: hypothetical protein V3V06_06180 [Dehalococcoidia bacterium]